MSPMQTARSDTSAIRRILTTLVDQQRRLRASDAPLAEVEANRKAIAYWYRAGSRDTKGPYSGPLP
jgi:hypothetical protein